MGDAVEAATPTLHQGQLGRGISADGLQGDLSDYLDTRRQAQQLTEGRPNLSPFALIGGGMTLFDAKIQAA